MTQNPNWNYAPSTPITTDPGGDTRRFAERDRQWEESNRERRKRIAAAAPDAPAELDGVLNQHPRIAIWLETLIDAKD